MLPRRIYLPVPLLFYKPDQTEPQEADQEGQSDGAAGLSIKFVEAAIGSSRRSRRRSRSCQVVTGVASRHSWAFAATAGSSNSPSGRRIDRVSSNGLLVCGERREERRVVREVFQALAALARRALHEGDDLGEEARIENGRLPKDVLHVIYRRVVVAVVVVGGVSCIGRRARAAVLVEAGRVERW